jgi:hypothetical protein
VAVTGALMPRVSALKNAPITSDMQPMLHMVGTIEEAVEKGKKLAEEA